MPDAWSRVPIFVLSAGGQDRDKVEALDLGADGYLIKPFGIAELLAQVRAVLRRTCPAADPRLTVRNVAIDLWRATSSPRPGRRST